MARRQERQETDITALHQVKKNAKFKTVKVTKRKKMFEQVLATIDNLRTHRETMRASSRFQNICWASRVYAGGIVNVCVNEIGPQAHFREIQKI